MTFSRIIGFLKYYWHFNPFRCNFILFVAVIYTSTIWLKHSNSDTSSFSSIIFLMAKIALVFAVSITLIAFCTVVFCALHFILKKGNRTSQSIELSTDLEASKNNILGIKTILPFALKPLLGFVKVRLIYNKHHFTSQYIVAGRAKKQFISFNTGLASSNLLELPNIQEYHFSEAFISFEDFLQFFSFTTNVQINNTICNVPHSILASTNTIQPKKTEEEQIRIDQLRKVEGEYLNYKKFEDSDDVRRIVWKLFAKNKELVVRVPEIMDPFASHVYVYASFENSSLMAQSEFETVLLNRFKNCVWTIYDALTKKDFDVRYISDQTIHTSSDSKNVVLYTIACSQWHHNKSIKEYFKPKIGSVLCIHSFTSALELEKVLAQCDQHTSIFFVQLSSVFKSHYIMNWFLRIILKPSPDRLSRLRSKWALHPLKFKTLSNEKLLYSILKKSNLIVEYI